MSETRTVKLGDVCEQVEKVNPSNEFTNSFIYIDLSAVDNQKKIITGSKEISVNEAPSRARQLLKSGDVLVSTVRPNLNAVAIVPTELDNAIGSTGFSVLRADTQKIRNDYLFAWVNNPQFVQEMVKLATGASYPAVSDRIVKESLIPLPSLAEQQRIADKFRLERLIEQKRARQRELIKEFRNSIFQQKIRTLEWDTPLEELADIQIGPFGSILHRSDYVSNGVPVINPTHIVDSKINPNINLSVPPILATKLSRYRLKENDIILGRRGEMGRASLVSKDFEGMICGTGSIIIRPFNPKNSSYILKILTTQESKNRLNELASGATMPNLNANILGKFKIPNMVNYEI